MTFKQYTIRRRLAGVGLAALAIASVTLSVRAEDAFDLDALIAAAKAEAPITVYAVTGKIVDTAAAFTEKYGVQATGKKVNEAGQVELMIRESQASNIVGDVALAGDVGAIMGQLIPQGIAVSWLPPDIAGNLPDNAKDPLIVVSDPHVWTYNTEVYQTCPVTNIWQLTEPEWNRKIAMTDPLEKPAYADWFNQMETHYDDAIGKAYADLYGKPLETGEATATAAWVKAYAENSPLLADSSAVAEAVGAPGQAAPFFGIMSTAKYRENVTGGLKLGICKDLAPFTGWLYPGLGMIAKGTKSPNAARLFVHYLMTEEGISAQTVDGKVSSNKQVPLNAEEASGVAAVLDQLMPYASGTATDDFDRRQDWQDFWRVNYKR
jgi:iron(III) transport system substrate-binding protein